MSETKIKNEVINSGISMKALEKNVREVENFLKNSMKEFEVLDFGKDGKVHWTNTKTGRMFRNLIKSWHNTDKNDFNATIGNTMLCEVF